MFAIFIAVLITIGTTLLISGSAQFCWSFPFSNELLNSSVIHLGLGLFFLISSGLVVLGSFL